MQKHIFEFTINGESHDAASPGVRALIDELREVEGVLEVDRLKADPMTMDLGSIVQIIASSSATLAIAQGLATWLRSRRNVSLRIERDSKSGSIKAEVSGIDPETALQIVEILREG